MKNSLNELAASRFLVLETLLVTILIAHTWILPVPLAADEAAAFSNGTIAEPMMRQAGPLPALLLSGLETAGLNSPDSLRLACVILHALNAALLATLSTEIFGISFVSGALCGLAFGLWPTNSFLLFFPFSLGQLMAATLLFMALLDYAHNGAYRRVFMWTAAGLLCHPMALALPLLCLALDLSRKHAQKALKAALAALLFIIPAALFSAYSRIGESPARWALPSLHDYALFLLRSLPPFQPFTQTGSVDWLAAMLVCATAAWLGLKYIEKSRAHFVIWSCAALCLVPLLPALIFGSVPVRNLIPEHSAYLAPLAACWLTGLIVDTAWRARSSLRYALAGLLAAACLTALNHIPRQARQLSKDSSYWKSVSAVYSHEPRFLSRRAEAMRLEGDAAGALETFKKALHMTGLPAYEASYNMRGIGEIALDVDRPGSAIVYFSSALKADPYNAKAKIMLARAYTANSQRAAAEQVLGQANSPALLYQRAIVRLNMKKYKEAFSDFGAACAQDPSFCPAL